MHKGRELFFVLAISAFMLAAAADDRWIRMNEILVTESASSSWQYIEILTRPNTDLSDIVALAIDSDKSQNPGNITFSCRFGLPGFQVADSNGYASCGFYFLNSIVNAKMPLNSITVVLVKGYDPEVFPLFSDADPSNSGSLLPNLGQILDNVGIKYYSNNIMFYSPKIFGPLFDGVLYPPGGLARYPDGTGDWVRMDAYCVTNSGPTFWPNFVCNPELISQSIPSPNTCNIVFGINNGTNICAPVVIPTPAPTLEATPSLTPAPTQNGTNGGVNGTIEATPGTNSSNINTSYAISSPTAPSIVAIALGIISFFVAWTSNQ